MGRKKLLAVLIIAVLCFMSITYAIAASATGMVTATSVFDPVAKTVTISGTTESVQVFIQITDTESATPVRTAYANVVDGSYSTVLEWSVPAQGVYTVTVKDAENNMTSCTFTTLNQSDVNAAVDVIKAYAEGDDVETLTVEQLTATGVTAVIEANLAAYKARLASVAGSDVDTVTKIQALINAVNNEEAAKHGNGVEIEVTYDATAKAVTIAGSATCVQVEIRVIKNGDTSPTWYGHADVSNGAYAIVLPASTYSEGLYNVTVKNDDTSSTVTASFTIAADTTAPVITIGEYNTNPTNQSITVTATVNEGTLNAASHTFEENGSFDFVATDEAGNVTTKTVTIANIDKTVPVITIGEYATAPTNNSITVTATANEGTLNAASHTFDENGSFEFTATDAAGNVAKTTVTIANIDKTAPVITIGDYTKDTTDQDITVTATTNEGTLNAASYVFTENGSFEFVATDAAGNVTRTTVTITNIDKTVPEESSEQPSEEISEESVPVSEEPSEVTSDETSEAASEISAESDTTSQGTPDTSDFGYFSWILIAMLVIATAGVLVRNRK